MIFLLVALIASAHGLDTGYTKANAWLTCRDTCTILGAFENNIDCFVQCQAMPGATAASHDVAKQCKCVFEPVVAGVFKPEVEPSLGFSAATFGATAFDDSWTEMITPTAQPTTAPTAPPTTAQPTTQPTTVPTVPTASPTTAQPTAPPTTVPPTAVPTATAVPTTAVPTAQPTTAQEDCYGKCVCQWNCGAGQADYDTLGVYNCPGNYRYCCDVVPCTPPTQPTTAQPTAPPTTGSARLTDTFTACDSWWCENTTLGVVLIGISVLLPASVYGWFKFAYPMSDRGGNTDESVTVDNKLVEI